MTDRNSRRFKSSNISFKVLGVQLKIVKEIKVCGKFKSSLFSLQAEYNALPYPKSGAWFLSV